MSDLSPIHALLTAKEAEIAALDAQKEILCRDAEVLRDALRAMGDPTVPPKAEKKTSQGPTNPRKRADSKAGTRLSPRWRAAFGKLAEEDREFSYDEVIAAVGGDVSKSLARTKMGDFQVRGLVARKKPGFFVLTEQGKLIAREVKEAEGPTLEPPASQPPQTAAPVAPEPPKVLVQGIGAPGVSAPSAPVAAPVAAQAASGSGVPPTQPGPGA